MAGKKSKESKPLAPPVEVMEPKLPIVFGRPTLYKPEYCQMLVDHMEQGLSFESFGAICNASRATLYNWAKEHPEFLDAQEVGKRKLLYFWELVARNVSMGVIPAPQAGTISTRGNAHMTQFMLQVHGRETGFNKDGIPFFEDKDTSVTFEYIDASKKARDVSPDAED